jgi:hypothetical protein
MLTLIAKDSFTSDGNSKNIDLPANADFFRVVNYTQTATQQTPGRGIEFEWWKGFDDDAARMISKEDGADTVTYEIVTEGGFTLIETYPAPEAEKTGTAVTDANPAEVTINSHGYSNGDRIRIYGTTAMQQIAGMDFTIANVATNTFELEFLDASGFTDAATAVKARRLPKQGIVKPATRYITNITKASQAVVTFSVDHEYVVDQYIQINVPADFGMVEMDGLSGKVVSVDSANNTVTLDIDSTNFTAFAFPESGDIPIRFPIAAPDGHEENYDGGLAYQRGLFLPYMHLAAGVDSPAGSNNDVIYWEAWRAE